VIDNTHSNGHDAAKKLSREGSNYIDHLVTWSLQMTGMPDVLIDPETGRLDPEEIEDMGLVRSYTITAS
jgi:hypothetical protein